MRGAHRPIFEALLARAPQRRDALPPLGGCTSSTRFARSSMSFCERGCNPPVTHRVHHVYLNAYACQVLTQSRREHLGLLACPKKEDLCAQTCIGEQEYMYVCCFTHQVLAPQSRISRSAPASTQPKASVVRSRERLWSPRRYRQTSEGVRRRAESHAA